MFLKAALRVLAAALCVCTVFAAGCRRPGFAKKEFVRVPPRAEARIHMGCAAPVAPLLPGAFQ